MAYRKTSGRPGTTRMAMSGLMEENPKGYKEVGEEMLSNIGRQVINLLQAGGNRLDKMDRAYVDKLEARTNPTGNIFNTTTRGVPIKDIIQGQGDEESQIAALIENAYKVGVLGSNVASRYALPAGAAILGAKGLADITGGIYDEASEIPLY